MVVVLVLVLERGAREIEVVRFRNANLSKALTAAARKVAAPPSARRELPSLTEKGPDLDWCSTRRLVPHSKVNRQRRASGVERAGRKRIDLSLQRSTPIAGKYCETLPTKPSGGIRSIDPGSHPAVKVHQVARESWIQKKSSDQHVATKTADAVRVLPNGLTHTDPS